MLYLYFLFVNHFIRSWPYVLFVMKLGGLLEDLVWILRKTSMNDCYTLLSIHGNPKNCSFKIFIMPAFTKKLARFRRIGPVSSGLLYIFYILNGHI